MARILRVVRFCCRGADGLLDTLCGRIHRSADPVGALGLAVAQRRDGDEGIAACRFVGLAGGAVRAVLAVLGALHGDLAASAEQLGLLAVRLGGDLEAGGRQAGRAGGWHATLRAACKGAQRGSAVAAPSAPWPAVRLRQQQRSSSLQRGPFHLSRRPPSPFFGRAAPEFLVRNTRYMYAVRTCINITCIWRTCIWIIHVIYFMTGQIL